MKFLVIQTAFLGDVILATSVVEKLRSFYPDAAIDFLLRKGNEGVLEGHPYIREVIILNKKESKLRNLLKIASIVKGNKYDHVINLHRFAGSGFIAWRSGAKEKSGFDKNPFSFCYTNKASHSIGNGKHETERNHDLIRGITDNSPALPKLYPPENIRMPVSTGSPYICVAPASVWHTKQFPESKWIELLKNIPQDVYLIGGKEDAPLCEQIRVALKENNIVNLAGKLSILQTAALMKGAMMNYVNDSAPLHIASAMNAPVTAVFCSTIPEFGFGPLSKNSRIVQTKEKLPCRPCGLHGHRHCPQGHFNCARTIDVKEMLA